jgi:hypothetical protein
VIPAERCGACAVSRSVAAGSRYGFVVRGEVRYLPRAAALERLAGKCRCAGARPAGAEPLTFTEVSEVRRPGQRALRRGVNVRVQLKRAAGTRRDEGVVVRLLDNGTVDVLLLSGGSVVNVPVDEWVSGRAGSTRLPDGV